MKNELHKKANDIAVAIRQNADNYWNSYVGWAEFDSKAKQLWRDAGENEVIELVTDILNDITMLQKQRGV